MLTATYSLVAIAAEQDKARNLLHRLQQFIQASWKGLQSIDFRFLETGYERMQQFDHFFQRRKICTHLMPALKGVSREADLLVAELDSLGGKASRILRTIMHRMTVRREPERVEVGELCESMQVYCNHVHARLQLEEQSLLPLARRTLSVEDWFRVASELLSSDNGVRRRMRREPTRIAASAGRSGDLH